MADEKELPSNGLSEKRIAEIKAKAVAKVTKEREAALEAKLLKEFEDAERRDTGVQEPLESVLVDMPEYCDRILLDGVAYFHGRSYTLPRSQCDVVREIVQNTWEHQSQIDGKRDSFYRTSRNQHLGPEGVSSNILRV